MSCSARKPHLQGRFSGRLATKDDEKKLNQECRLLGPLLGGVGKRGDGSRLTLAKIVRGIAAGEVRKFCEERERVIKVCLLASCVAGGVVVVPAASLCPESIIGCVAASQRPCTLQYISTE